MPIGCSFSDIIRPACFHFVLYASLIESYIRQHNIISDELRATIFSDPTMSLPIWRNFEFMDYNVPIKKVLQQGNKVVVDRINSYLYVIMQALFADYLASRQIYINVENWLEAGPVCVSDRASANTCLVLNGNTIMKCWKALFYKLNFGLGGNSNFLQIPYVLPFIAEEGFFVLNGVPYDALDNPITTFIRYPSLAEKDDTTELIYILPMPNHKTFNFFTRLIIEPHISRPLFNGDKINLLEYLENSVAQLDSLLLFYNNNTSEIEAFFISEEGDAFLRSPAISVIHNFAAYLGTAPTEDYESVTFYLSE